MANIERARTILYVSIVLIPLGAVVGFLHGGLGLTLMVLGWIGVLFYDGPAHGKARFGRSLEPQPLAADAPPQLPKA
jgi:hypothetical protein